MMVTLNAAEQKLAKFLAQSRYQNARKREIKDAKMGEQTNWETDLEGVAAEIAFCKLFNVYPDMETDLPPDKLPDADAYTFAMGAVDVKATKRPNGRLLARKNKATKNIDTFVLMIGVFPEYQFVGSASADKLLQDSTLRDLGRGEGHCLDQNDLDKYDGRT
jgi:hypothetical protein